MRVKRWPPRSARQPCSVHRRVGARRGGRRSSTWRSAGSARLDIMFNNAGISCAAVSGLARRRLDDFDRVMRVNVLGVDARNAQRGAGDEGARRRGSILNNASIAGTLAGCRHDDLSRLQGGADPVQQIGGDRSRPVRHPGELHRARPRPHRSSARSRRAAPSDAAAKRIAAGVDAAYLATSRSSGAASRSTSPRPRCSWRATASRQITGIVCRSRPA